MLNATLQIVLDRSFLKPGLVAFPGAAPIKVWLCLRVSPSQNKTKLLLETDDIGPFIKTFELEKTVVISPYATILRGVFQEGDDSFIEIYDALGKTEEFVIPAQNNQYEKVSKLLIWQVHKREF